MPLVPCQCTNCGGTLEIDNTLEAAVCKFCGTPFIVEKAINNYNIKNVNITMEAKDSEALVKKGKRMLLDVYYSTAVLSELAEDLSNISKDEFYPEFFAFAAGDKYNEDWLVENSNAEQKKEIIDFLFLAIIRDYNKEKWEDVKLNIVKNYEGVPYHSLGNDTIHRCIVILSKLKNYFTASHEEKWNHLCQMAEEEISALIANITTIKQAILAWGYSEAYVLIVGENLKDSAHEAVLAFARNAKSDEFNEIYELSSMINDHSLFRIKIAKDVEFTFDSIYINGKEYPNSYVREICYTGEQGYMLLQLDSVSCTVVRLTECRIRDRYLRAFPEITLTYEQKFEEYITYKDMTLYGLKLVYKEGISYKENTTDKVLKGIGKFLGKLFN